MIKLSASGVFGRLERFAPTGADRRSVILLGIYALAMFLVFLLFTFPHDLQLRRWLGTIHKQSGWRIHPESVTFVPWEGYRLHGVTITPPGAPEGAHLDAERLSLHPRLLEILVGRASTFVFSARAYDGKLSGTFSGGSRTKIDLTIDGASLAAAETLRRWVGGEWAGKLSGRLVVDAGPDVRTLSGEAHLELTGGALRGGNVSGFKIPDLAFARGDADVNVEGGKVALRKLTLAGDQIEAGARGDFFLRTPIPLSSVNLTVGIRPVPGAAPDIENMLLLWNRNQRPPGGSYALTIGGTIGRPRLR